MQQDRRFFSPRLGHMLSICPRLRFDLQQLLSSGLGEFWFQLLLLQQDKFVLAWSPRLVQRTRVSPGHTDNWRRVGETACLSVSRLYRYRVRMKVDKRWCHQHKNRRFYLCEKLLSCLKQLLILACLTFDLFVSLHQSFVTGHSSGSFYWVGLTDEKSERWEWVNETPYVMDRRWIIFLPSVWNDWLNLHWVSAAGGSTWFISQSNLKEQLTFETMEMFFKCCPKNYLKFEFIYL